MIELKDFPDRNTLEALHARFAELDIPSLESWLAILQSAALLEERLNSFLAAKGMQQNRFFTLIILYRYRNGLTISALAGKIGVSCPTMTGLIQRMERDGLVMRIASPGSRRESIIQLSETGDRLLASTLPDHYLLVTQIMQGLDPEEHAILHRTLSKILPTTKGDVP